MPSVDEIASQVAELSEQVAALTASLEALDNALARQLGWHEQGIEKRRREIEELASDLRHETSQRYIEIDRLRSEIERSGGRRW